MDSTKLPRSFYVMYFWTHYWRFMRSQPFEGDGAHMDFKEGMYWAFKYYVRYIEKAERGKGLERFFDKQDLAFAPGDGFVEECSCTISAGGDLLPTEHLKAGNSKLLWSEVRDFYYGADLVTANLESPFAESASARYLAKPIAETPNLNNSRDIFDILVDGGRGINFFSTANNHALDQGEEGLVSTLDFLDAKGYPHVGTARSREERDKPVIVERNGIKVAFISYTFSLNKSAIPEGKDYLVNHLRLNHGGVDIGRIQRQVKEAKAAGADAVVACLHWSLEYESYPTEQLIETAHRLAESGIDVIIGNHAHSVQPIECYRHKDGGTGEEKRSLIIYALGDLVSSNQPGTDSNLGNLAKFRISKGRSGGKACVRVNSLEILPIYIYHRMEGGECVDFRLLDLARLSDGIRAGKNTIPVTEDEGKDILRLERLAKKLFGPATWSVGPRGKRSPTSAVG